MATLDPKALDAACRACWPTAYTPGLMTSAMRDAVTAYLGALPQPTGDAVERVARAVFAVGHPHEGWDEFDARKEARGGALHPFQEQAVAIARAAIAALPAADAGVREAVLALETIANVDDDGFTSDGHERNVETAVRALSAIRALRTGAPSASPAGEVAVKPLEWVDRGLGVARAESLFGYYKVNADGMWWIAGGSIGGGGGKDAAQADYEARVRSVLYTGPAGEAKS